MIVIISTILNKNFLKIIKKIDKQTWQWYTNDNKTCQGDIIMNKEEILEKSRKENKDSDEMEIFALTYAGKIASKVGMLFCSGASSYF